MIAKALKVPFYISALTAPAIDWGGAAANVVPFQAGTAFPIGDILVNSFTIPHDAVDPVGFTFVAEGVKVGLAMDLGYLPDSVKFHLRGSHWLLLESNHDLEMLKVGPYPWAVKQRVMGRKGHLSNDVVSEYIRADLDEDVHTLVLGHLSEHNNHPEIVRMVAAAALMERGAAAKLVVAAPRKQSDVFQF